MHDISKIIENIYEIVKSHRIDNNGAYCRWLWQDEENSRELGINEYGCADAINILYTIGKMPEEKDRVPYAQTLQKLQNSETGLFTESTHHPIHTTAHCAAALELLDAKPIHKMVDLHKYLTKDGLYSLLDNLNWANDPWPSSHQGAGIYAAFVLADEADEEWQKWYFDWLWENADDETGFWRKGYVNTSPAENGPTIFPNLAGSFHYLFNHEYAKMPLRYPEKMIDSCLDIYNRNTWPSLGKRINFAEIDWVYCLTRSLRQCNHRFDEVKAALKSFADGYIDFMNSIDPETHDEFNDLHQLFGATCALAELQQALPGYIKTKKPLRLVLDRRPFI